MSKWAVIALSLVFVVSTVVSLFGAGRAINAFLKGVVWDLYPCIYRPMLAPVDLREAGSTAKELKLENPECVPDKKRPLEDMVDGLAMLLPAAPLAYITFRQVRKKNEGVS